jgi:hypothetical protein
LPEEGIVEHLIDYNFLNDYADQRFNQNVEPIIIIRTYNTNVCIPAILQYLLYEPTRKPITVNGILDAPNRMTMNIIRAEYSNEASVPTIEPNIKETNNPGASNTASKNANTNNTYEFGKRSISKYGEVRHRKDVNPIKAPTSDPRMRGNVAFVLVGRVLGSM